MLRNVVAVAALVVGLASAAVAAPADYQIEARGKPKGTGSDLIVKVKHVPSGKYVTDAKVWYFTSTQGLKNAPKQSVSKLLPSDGKEGYRVRVRLRAQTGDQFEHFMVSIPAEGEPIHARVPVKFSDK